jgi:hypothetical protein
VAEVLTRERGWRTDAQTIRQLRRSGETQLRKISLATKQPHMPCADDVVR